jgi:tetratricopeptide (TPR) repeat protein
MVAYELLTGSYPFGESDSVTLAARIVNTELPRPSDPIDARLRPILQRLLAKDPARRFADAAEVIVALGAALQQPIPVETVATRESFLQTAPLIGRDVELATLLDALSEARRGTGSAWLIGGESGVGKSRLLDELRVKALVHGVAVVRGQAVNQGGGPYHAWRDVISQCVLRIDVSDADAEVLKAVVPDIGALLGRPIGDPPPVDAEATQSRLLLTVEEVVRMQPGCVLMILEDLQWAGSESLKMMTWLAHTTGHLPLLLVGSFRTDEAPALATAVTGAQLLVVKRLDTDHVAALSESMIGSAGLRPEVLALLARETEGIPFFVVEVMRALAESCGDLRRIGDAPLPERVISGGMQRILRGRLGQISTGAMTALKTAAVIGRHIDPPLLSALHPRLSIEEWGYECARAAVLELRDQRWRFAHDKLREQLLEDLSATSRRALHRRVAEAIEAEYGSRADYITALAHHWRQAGEPTHEAKYAYEAGALALQGGACREAIEQLARALEILRVDPRAAAPAAGTGRTRVRPRLRDLNAHVDPESPAFRLGMIEGALGEAYYRLGDLAQCRAHAERALHHFGQRVPQRTIGWVTAAAWQAVLRCWQVAWRVRPSDSERTRRVAAEIARVELKLVDAFFYALRPVPLAWASLRVLNQCEPAGPSPELAQGYALNAIIAGSVPILSLADAWGRHALEIAERIGTDRLLAWVLTRLAVQQLSLCRWADADAGVGRASELAAAVGDPRTWEEARSLNGLLTLYNGQYERCLALFDEGQRMSRRSGNRQAERWGLLGEASAYVRLGRLHEAVRVFDHALDQLDEEAMKGEAIWGFGMLALARFRLGDDRGAFEMADRALWYATTTKAALAYWSQPGLAGATDVMLGLVERRGADVAGDRSVVNSRALQAVNGMRRFGRRLRFGRPFALLFQGLRAWHDNRPRRAMRLWRRTVTLAEQLGTPYERGRAHLEIGRHLEPTAQARLHHLRQAIEIFEKLGCGYDVERARTELARPGAAPC